MVAATNTDDFELDEVGWCMFAALIDGLRLIGERERETGIPISNSRLDHALMAYVQTKGKQIARACDIMSDEKHPLRWTNDELRSVAEETRRRFPDRPKFTLRHFQEAQSILPVDRRKSLFTYPLIERLRSLIPVDAAVSPPLDPPIPEKVAPPVVNGTKPAPTAVLPVPMAPPRPDSTGSAPLFLYLTTCGLADAELNRLRGAGYVPIAVDSFESVKVVDVRLLGAHSDAVAAAAYAAIRNDDSIGKSVQREFGRLVSEALS